MTCEDLERPVIEALEAAGGEGRPASVCEQIWREHEERFRQAGELFYTWQCDVRWAATRLRNRGVLAPERVG